MFKTRFARLAAEKGWSEATQIAALLRAIDDHAAAGTAAAILAELRGSANDTASDAPVDRFMWHVVALLGNPGLALSAAFQEYCLNCWDLLTPMQAAERWRCWNAA